tara:strand:- start:11740 stop:13542 length:1803 start_codon:yes stop_codon:yes gene_type:complete
MNKKEMKIIHEELARAVLISEAKKRLDEGDFAIFMSELRDYENNMPLNESLEPELLYEGLISRLKNIFKGAGKKIAPDKVAQADKLAGELAEIDQEIATAAELRRTPNEIKALEVKRDILLKKLSDIDPNVGAEAEKAVEEEGASGEAGGEMKGKPKVSEKEVEQQFKQVGQEMDTPKSRGILGAIYDNYLKAFQFMPALLGAGIRKLNQIGREEPRRQDDLLLQFLMMMMQQTGQQVDVEKIKDENEDLSEDPIDGEGGEAAPKQNTVAGLQDKVILALNKVLDTKDVDMSRRDTMELAKKLTKNLVDQMLANGIEFKGMKAQVQEAILSALEGRLLTEQEEAGEEAKEEKPENDRVQKLIRMRVRRFTMNPANFLNGLKKVRREFAEKEYGKKEIFRQYINSDVEQEFVGLYDAYLDVMALGKAYKELQKRAKEDENIAKALEKADSQVIMVAGKKVKGRKISSLVVHFANFYRLASDDNQAPDHPAQLKKYAELKKKAVRLQKGGKDAKDMYKPEKVPDTELPKGQKGQINIKNLIFQALKGMEITGEKAQDIESLLNKRLQSVAKQYIAKGMEINVLEEKLNRYTKSVIKEIKDAM